MCTDTRWPALGTKAADASTDASTPTIIATIATIATADSADCMS
jgi:hypothetical protein